MWYKKLSELLTTLGFCCSKNDPALWIRAGSKGQPPTYLVVWVDDMLLVCTDKAVLHQLGEGILGKYKGKLMPDVTQYLNMLIEQDQASGAIRLSQPRHITGLISLCGLDEAHPKSVPIQPGADLSAFHEGDKDLAGQPYLQALGSLLYISNCTRPDVAYASSALGRAASRPALRHWEILKGVVRYLKGTTTYALTFSGDSPLVGFTDSDYAACKDTRRSRAAFAFVCCGGAVSWSSKLLPSMTTSTAEAEYMAGSKCAKEGVWIRRVAWELGLHGEGPITIRGDNVASLLMAGEGATSSRTKHVDIAAHFFREVVEHGIIQVDRVATEDNTADILTKPLPGPAVEKHRRGLGLMP
jgi:hypothetical protein